MAEGKEKLKSLLIRVKEESERVRLKTKKNKKQKTTKIMEVKGKG